MRMVFTDFCWSCSPADHLNGENPFGDLKRSKLVLLAGLVVGDWNDNLFCSGCLQRYSQIYAIPFLRPGRSSIASSNDPVEG